MQDDKVINSSNVWHAVDTFEMCLSLNLKFLSDMAKNLKLLNLIHKDPHISSQLQPLSVESISDFGAIS